MPTNDTNAMFADDPFKDDPVADFHRQLRQGQSGPSRGTSMPPELLEYQESQLTPPTRSLEDAGKEFKEQASRANFLGMYRDDEGKMRYLNPPSRKRRFGVDESDMKTFEFGGQELTAGLLTVEDEAGPPSRGQAALAGVVYETPRNTGAFIGSGVDLLGDATGAYDTNIGPWIEDNIPSLDRSKADEGTILAADIGTIVGGLMASGGLLGGAVVGAGRAASTGASNIDRAWNATKAVAALKASETVIGSAMDSKTEPFLVGEDGYIKKMFGFDPGAELTGSEDERSRDIFANNLNVIADGILLTGLMGTGVSAAKAVHGAGKIMLSPLLNMKKSTHEQRVLKDLADRLALAGNESPEAVTQRISDFMENPENRQVLVNTFSQYDDATRAIDLDPVAAIRRGVRDGSLDLSQEQVALLINWQNSLERLTGQSGAVATARATPTRELEALFQEGSRILGDDAADLSRRQVVEHVQSEINRDLSAIASAKVNRDNLVTTLADEISNDPAVMRVFSDQFQELGIQLNPRATPNQLRDQLMKGMERAYVAARAETNNAFGLIKGGPVDADGLVSAIRSMSRPVLDEAGKYGAYKYPQTQALFKAIQPPRSAGGGVASEFTDEDLSRQVSQWISDNNVTFETLYTDVRPALSRIASSTDQPSVRMALRDFINWIDEDALAHVARSDHPAANAAQNAMEVYKARIAPWRDEFVTSSGTRLGGALQDFTSVMDRLHNTPLQNAESVMDESMRRWFSTTVVPQDSTTVPRAGRLQGIIDQNAKYFGNKEVIPEYMLADAISSGTDHFRSLRNQGLSAQEAVDETVRLYSKWGEVFSEQYPSFANRLNQVLESLQKNANNVSGVEYRITQLEEIAKQSKDRLVKDEFSAFFRNNNIETANMNTRQVLGSLMKDPDNKLQPVLDLAKNNPVIRDGLRAAWLREAQDRMFSMTRESSGVTPLRAGRTQSEFIDDPSALARSGEAIFGADDPVYESIITLAELGADTQLARQARQIAGDSSTVQAAESSQAAKRFINESILMTFGPLTRTGARIRVMGNRAIDLFASKDPYLSGISAQIAANPEEFARVMRSIDSTRSVVTDRNARNYLLGLGARAGFYSHEDVEGSVSEALAAAITTTMDMEEDYRRSSSDGQMGVPMSDSYIEEFRRRHSTTPRTEDGSTHDRLDIDAQMRELLAPQ